LANYYFSSIKNQLHRSTVDWFSMSICKV